MIKFFRKIRRQLLTENKFSKYLIYAIGEIVLIVIGIFIALQLQNWNENRKQEAQFKNTLEQLYSTINYDTETFLNDARLLELNIESIEVLLEKADSISDSELILKLFDLAYDDADFYSESILYAKDLFAHPEKERQKALSKEILIYINTFSNFSLPKNDQLLESIRDNDIAAPYRNANNKLVDTTYYTATDFNIVRNLLKTRKFRSKLKTVGARNQYKNAISRRLYNDGISILALIKNFYPEVKILYKDVGIIGTAINGYDDVGAHSTPMKLTDLNRNIWEITMKLKKGTVKFRCRDSWSQNWGGSETDEFPNGDALRDGGDIPIPSEGNYKIVLNLTENTYQFIQQDD